MPELLESQPEIKEKNLAVDIYQAKAVLGNVNTEMKPNEIRKFRLVYQNSGNCSWPSDVKLIRVSGDPLETETSQNQNEVKANVYFMI